MLAAKRLHSPLVMKIPFDSTTITIPADVKQYEPFEVALNLDTKQLAKFLNEIVAAAAEGTSIQGIAGEVSSSMKAEVISEGFKPDKLGPQESPSIKYGVANWRWLMTPDSSGAQHLKFRLHLTTQHNGQQVSRVLDFAEANFVVQANLSEWFNRNGLWIAVLLLIPTVLVWKFRYRFIGLGERR